MNKITGRYGVVWGRHKLGHNVELFRGKVGAAKCFFNRLAKTGDYLLGDRIGLVFRRTWSNGVTDEITADLRFS